MVGTVHDRIRDLYPQRFHTGLSCSGGSRSSYPGLGEENDTVTPTPTEPHVSKGTNDNFVTLQAAEAHRVGREEPTAGLRSSSGSGTPSPKSGENEKGRPSVPEEGEHALCRNTLPGRASSHAEGEGTGDVTKTTTSESVDSGTHPLRGSRRRDVGLHLCLTH